ncbi:MAG: hypothetical protein RIB49_00755 [Rhodospirillales bacterium]
MTATTTPGLPLGRSRAGPNNSILFQTAYHSAEIHALKTGVFELRVFRGDRIRK